MGEKMKATLQFNLPEDAHDFKQSCKGVEWSLMVYELDQWAREIQKYTEKNTLTADELREKIRELMYESGLEMPS